MASVKLFPDVRGALDDFLKVVRAFIWFVGIPLLVIRLVFKEKASVYGLRLPDLSAKNVRWLSVLALALFISAGIFLSASPSFRDFYAFENPTISRFVFLVALPLLAYYVAEEFFMRGFLLFRLHRHIGVHAIWVSGLLFALLHVSKPPLEIPIAFFAGMLLAVLALKTKSFVLPAIAHFLMGLAVNVLVSL